MSDEQESAPTQQFAKIEGSDVCVKVGPKSPDYVYRADENGQVQKVPIIRLPPGTIPAFVWKAILAGKKPKVSGVGTVTGPAE